jgi:predicted membrane protein
MSTEPKKQTPFKFLLAILTAGVLVYTVVAIQNDGADFLSKAIGFITSLTWMGQFTFDFSCYLVLSALWIMWRNEFSGRSILIGIAAGIMGIVVFAPYLIYLIGKEKGDLKRVLCGSKF